VTGRLGIIADVHGNLVALEAVIADAEARGVDRWWALGDLVAIGPDPAATLERIRSLPGIEALRGNTERYTLTRDRPYPSVDDVRADPSLAELFAAVHGSFTWTRGALSVEQRAWLSALPTSLRTTLDDGTRVLGVHASPHRDDGPGISPHRDEAELAGELHGVDADVVVGGHTHRPTDRIVAGGVRVLNPGPLSNPILEEKRAGYLILDGPEATQHFVEYDVDEALRRIDASGHPEGDYLASFLRG
jgi:predicted phosphodiesterase